MFRAIDAVLSNMFQPHAGSKEAQRLQGLAAGPGVYEGTARVVRDISEAGNIQRGDILVALTTAPCYNSILPIIGAIVTERGGLLSHAAIVAREYGLPAVVGCTGATQKIKSGARVRVDGSKGEVQILS
jgi:pyruvate,water dikinase